MIATRNSHGMGSWLSSILHDVGGVVAGDGNIPGTAETRAIGYDSGQVAQAAGQLLSQPAPPSVQSELLLMGAAGVGLMLLLRSGKR